MKNIFLLIVASFASMIVVLPLKGQEIIIHDTTWVSDTVRVYNDIVVEYPATLTINPGVYVEFQGNYSIDVSGKIKAIGTEDFPITFTVADTSGYADTTSLAGGWGSVKLMNNTVDTSIFNYCSFSYGKAIDPGNDPLNNTNHDNLGGAIFAFNYMAFYVENCVFLHNRAINSGGAIYAIDLQTLIVKNSFFKDNMVLEYGGAVFINSVSTIQISKNIFTHNTAFRSGETVLGTMITGHGGALWLGSQTSNSIISENIFSNNISPGGALYETSYNCSIYNNILVNNKGTALINGHSYSISQYANNTIVNNKGYNHKMCGLVFFNPNLKMRNNIIFGNTSDEINWDPIQLSSPDQIKANLSYSCIPDEPIYYQGEGNITKDPQFVNPTAGAGPDYDGLSADWSLLDSSPCVNTGTPDTTGLNLPETDILGNPRVYGIRIDMGAIENQMVVGLPKNPLVSARVQVSPNPFGQSFKVIAPGNEKISSISLYNQNGKLLGKLDHLPFDQLMVYDLAKQPAGLYLMVTQFESGNVESTKLVKY